MFIVYCIVSWHKFFWKKWNVLLFIVWVSKSWTNLSTQNSIEKSIVNWCWRFIILENSWSKNEFANLFLSVRLFAKNLRSFFYRSQPLEVGNHTICCITILPKEIVVIVIFVGKTKTIINITVPTFRVFIVKAAIDVTAKWNISSEASIEKKYSALFPTRTWCKKIAIVLQHSKAEWIVFVFFIQLLFAYVRIAQMETRSNILIVKDIFLGFSFSFLFW